MEWMMMRCNRSRFSRLKQQFELKKMMAAYIGAEKQIMMNPGLTGFTDAKSIVDSISFKSYYQDENGDIIETFESMTPQQYHESDFGSQAEKDIILKKAKFLREQLDEAIRNEEFERCGELEKVLTDLRKRYENLD